MAEQDRTSKGLIRRITVNGSQKELTGPVGLTEFLQGLGVNLQFVAVAHNGEVVPRERYKEVTLKDGDTLEIVRPVGGG
ncbi:MAG: sulfur carrier protein ThiS [Chloroflexi bacterium]|nr:sulfur carrier protein ThiS [Chloroflexota bacterium]